MRVKPPVSDCLLKKRAASGVVDRGSAPVQENVC
jgi:hypothetical protein